MIKKVFFVGRFRLPDGTAAAQLIKGIGKILRETGYQTVFIDKEVSAKVKTKEIVRVEEKDYTIYKILYPYTWLGKFESYTEEKSVLGLLDRETNDICLAYYNYPSIGIFKFQRYTASKKITLIPIVTEWYSTQGRNFLVKIFKGMDIIFRMCLLQKKEKAMIVSSTFLEKYYADLDTFRIPAVIDVREEKWNKDVKPYDQDEINLVYAGSPGKNKDKIDKVLRLLSQMDSDIRYTLRVIGIGKQEYEKDFSHVCTDARIKFLGKLSHEECVSIITASDFTILYRNPDRVAMAGFPTKISESIACGIPAITTNTSDIKLYIKEGKNGFILPMDESAAHKKLQVIMRMNRKEIDRMKEFTRNYQPFDFHNYVPEAKEFMGRIEKEER